MTYSTKMRSAVCLAALIAGSAAHADITAAQVWEDWKEQLELYGEDSLTIGAEETSSGVVNIRDLTLSDSEDGVTFMMEVGDISFNEQSDGTVRVTMEQDIPITITGDDGVVFSILMTQNNLEMVVAGDPDAMDYAVTADSYVIAFQDLVDGDVTYTGDASMTASDVNIKYETRKSDVRSVSSTGTIGTIDVLVDFQIPGSEGEYVTAAAKINGLQAQSETVLPLDANFDDPDSLISDGMSVAGGYVIDSADYVFDINAEGDQAAGSISTGMVTLTGELNNETVGYESKTVDIAVNIQSSDFPLPIEVSLAQYGIGLRMPVGVTEAPADFALKFDMVDLAISDMLWNIFDAGNVLPRDPATFQIAIAGKAKAMFDMFDPAQQDAMTNAEVPFELESVTLDTLRISAAGALVTGGGSFVFDNTDTQTFAPLPRPEGDAVVAITGLNKLLDNLVAMGLVPAEDVMGPRMMMGMFARSTGDDQMEIGVEVNAAGEVKVNGNRVR